MNSKAKHIKDLERRAKKNELLPAFQLYQNYADGLDGVAKDSAEADRYFSQCLSYIEPIDSDLTKNFSSNRLKLTSLELFDFRRFKHLQKMSFEPKLTVLIGNNGEGKTTILDAIAKTLTYINTSILKEDGAGQRLSELYDIRINSDKSYTDVLTEFSYGNGLKRLPARLSRAKFGASARRDSDIKGLKELANVFRIINDNHLINLPLCAFYSVDRSHPLPRTNKNNLSVRTERFDAYNSALDGPGKFEHFVEWFIVLHKKSLGDRSLEIDSLQQQVKDLEASVKGGVLSFEPILEKTKQDLDTAIASMELARESHVLTTAQTKRVAVKAICSVIPSIGDIWVEASSGDDVVFVKNDSVDITIKQLSDGQRTFLGLVADLVRRLIMLNPKLDNPLEGQGIVLIDEIELHLHPKWQQDVLLDLQKCFPNVQFIITTHSPQVLSTVDKKNIRMFGGEDLNGGVDVDSPDFQTKGIINSDVLEQLMDTFAIPRRIDEAHWLDRFETLLNSCKYDDNSKAQELYKNIKEHFGEGSFELKKCNSLIKVQNLKRKAQSIIGQTKGEK